MSAGGANHNPPVAMRVSTQVPPRLDKKKGDLIIVVLTLDEWAAVRISKESGKIV